jgi:GAF domain-containing protein
MYQGFRHEGKNGVYVRAQKGKSTETQTDFENKHNDFCKIERPTKDKLAAPLQIKNEVVGYLCVAKRRKQTDLRFSSIDQKLFFALSRQIAHAIEIQQMRQLMASRYASMALNQNKKGTHADHDNYFSNFLKAVKYPDKVAKIIARSFYKDLRKAGFEPKQILVVASEIIENLNDAFRKTKAKTDNAES